MRLNLNLLQKFSIYSFLIILVLGLILGTVLSVSIEGYMTDRTKISVSSITQTHAAMALSPGIFDDPDYSKNKDVFSKFYSMIKTPEIVRIKVYNRDGTIIYSDEEGLVGENFRDNHEIIEALEGNLEAEIHRNLELKSEHTFERDFEGLMELYVPLDLGGGDIVGVVEVYQVLDDIDKDIANAKRAIWTTISIGFLFLFLVLFGVVKRASDTIHSQNLALKEYSVKLEEKVKERTAELEKSNHLKDIFTDIMRHDLLNPVGIIKTSAQLALKEEEDPEKKEYFENMIDSSERAIAMIENASILGKLESGEELTYAEEDLGAISKRAVEETTHLADKKNMKITNTSEGEFKALVNPLIFDVFSNLLSNAIKYGPENSEVVLGIEEDGPYWKITVADYGPGIPDEYKKDIFKRFERIKKSGVKGTGLGLAITERVIEIHNGKVWVEDNPTGGSLFIFKIPMSTAVLHKKLPHNDYN
ncbi:MAG: sensor histidine kinase [Candidatus Hydrothermarchaeales archaeon]